MARVRLEGRDLVIKGKLFHESKIAEKPFEYDVPLWLVWDIKLGEVPEGVEIVSVPIELSEHREVYDEIFARLPPFPHAAVFRVRRGALEVEVEGHKGYPDRLLTFGWYKDVVLKLAEKLGLTAKVLLDEPMAWRISVTRAEFDPDLTVVEAAAGMLEPIHAEVVNLEGKIKNLINSYIK